MTTFYALAARFCGLAAAVCLGLAFLASPAVSRADDDGPGGPGVPIQPGGCTGDCDNGCMNMKADCYKGNCNNPNPGKGSCVGCACKDYAAGPNCTCG